MDRVSQRLLGNEQGWTNGTTPSVGASRTILDEFPRSDGRIAIASRHYAESYALESRCSDRASAFGALFLSSHYAGARFWINRAHPPFPAAVRSLVDEMRVSARADKQSATSSGVVVKNPRPFPRGRVIRAVRDAIVSFSLVRRFSRFLAASSARLLSPVGRQSATRSRKRSCTLESNRDYRRDSAERRVGSIDRETDPLFHRFASSPRTLTVT